MFPTFDYDVPGVLRVNLTYRGCSIDFLSSEARQIWDTWLDRVSALAAEFIGPCHWSHAANGATYACDDAPDVRHIVFTSDVPTEESL